MGSSCGPPCSWRPTDGPSTSWNHHAALRTLGDQLAAHLATSWDHHAALLALGDQLAAHLATSLDHHAALRALGDQLVAPTPVELADRPETLWHLYVSNLQDPAFKTQFDDCWVGWSDF